MIQLIRGFKDILPEETPLWRHIERTATALFEDFGFREIRVPIMEKTDLFARSIGEETDIVEKEMYTFPDRKGDLITLRPEATASIVRSFVQHKLYAQKPVHKLYTIGPMFRRERPQKGRYRQFYQIDAEIFGDGSPYEDAQLIFMLVTLLERLSVTDTSAHINSLGCPACRPDFKAGLQAFLADKGQVLCEDCLRRRENNPLRVLDCKVPACRDAVADAPDLLDYLCDDCRNHFDTVQRALADLGVPFEVDKRLVRGLDYYTRTAFEIQTGALGAQSAVAGGGRYDGLVRALGGPDQPASGFAIGFDRLAEIVAMVQNDLQRPPALFVAALGEACRAAAFDWVCRLAVAGVNAEMSTTERSLKSQMKQAHRLGAPRVLIFGDDEMARGEAMLRDMATKEQQALPLEGIVETLQTILMAK
ncbi:MAG: histidine--tRNA ligase [Desulfobacterales bacterium]|nr:histidine--tRNA ligase [Desulfobacterales bacterium]